jgi:hypothetical protein
MAAEAEASREARAKVIAAEGEMKASRALKEASDVMVESPAALQVYQSLRQHKKRLSLLLFLDRFNPSWSLRRVVFLFNFPQNSIHLSHELMICVIFRKWLLC